MNNPHSFSRNILAKHGYVKPERPTLPPIPWIEQNFYLYDTGQLMTLFDCQRRPLELALQRDTRGLYEFTTIVWGWPKKSAKSSVIAAVADYTADTKTNASVKLIGNDLKQADSRVGYYVRESIKLAQKDGLRGGIKVTPSGYKIEYPHGGKIECIPIDPSGEAGGNDDMIVYSELWGWKSKAHQRMWSEMTLSPNKFGQSQRWIDTYAGFKGESVILEQLYDIGVKQGYRVWDDLEVYVNERAKMLVVWVTKPMFPWQVPEYYQEQATTLTPSEYNRMHGNQWADSSESFLPIEWWDACKVASLEPMRPRQSVVVALDAAVDSDCFAIVMMTVRKEGDIKIPQVRYARIWTPPKDGKIQFSNPSNPDDTDYPEGELRRLIREYSVACIGYDPTQLEDMANRLSRHAYFEKFDQGQRRAVADKRWYDIIRERRVEHTGEPDLREHIINSNRKPEDKYLRIIKRQAAMKIDLNVAASMCADCALKYNL